MIKLKTKYTDKDLEKFDKLLCQTELLGVNNYERNIGRIDLNEWLKKFSEETKNEMFKIIEDW